MVQIETDGDVHTLLARLLICSPDQPVRFSPGNLQPGGHIVLGHNKRLEGKLRAAGGCEAWATVLESTQLWASTGGMNKVPGQAGSFTIHQKLKLRVEPTDQEPFEVTVKQVFNDVTGQHIPQEGWSVKVIYDPSDHSRVVIDLDKMFVQRGVVDRDAAVARHEQAQAMARDPQARAKRIQQIQAEAMSRAGVSPDLLALQQDMAAKYLEGRGARAGQAAAPVSAPDIADQLSKLADLRDRGVLTESEFQRQKTKLLGDA
jgi:hypothetical protein